jgi:hypothetical protein
VPRPIDTKMAVNKQANIQNSENEFDEGNDMPFDAGINKYIT